MKTLKFKAWHKAEKRFINLNGMSIAFGAMTDKGQVYGITEQGVLHEYDKDEIELMQFTGLKDKHGKEIYEGDILHSESWCNSTIKTNPYHVVEWKGIGWKAKGYNGTMQVSPDLDVKSDFEIIGNIHQDENLLK